MYCTLQKQYSLGVATGFQEMNRECYYVNKHLDYFVLQYE